MKSHGKIPWCFLYRDKFASDNYSINNTTLPYATLR